VQRLRTHDIDARPCQKTTFDVSQLPPHVSKGLVLAAVAAGRWVVAESFSA